MSELQEQISRRRTFAIISHPDAGKTTVTEQLLLLGGAIQLAGTVKARKSSRHVTSDWMQMEKERGISITSSVMQFEYDNKVINLLDTPGHADFSEDTYRTLTAVDSALMVIDVAKGVEARAHSAEDIVSNELSQRASRKDTLSLGRVRIPGQSSAVLSVRNLANRLGDLSAANEGG